MTITLMDTSVAVPLLLSSHPDHALVASWAKGKDLAFAGHATFETYAVLTRLPVDSRLTPTQAQQLIAQFADSEHPLTTSHQEAVRLMATLNITGGQVYDGLVALSAINQKLATRDQRAHDLYRKLGVEVEIV
ncbi:MAG: PIN domain-containing protein [Propionibacteriaceae bacterium]|jgi:predicted nucleic acid-binding protein|nr:PIN domain-containing protein [Propionibacteriaceae bacterium]